MLKFLTIFAIFCGFVLAQDEGLYAPAPPADAAFVRIIHAAQAPVVSVSVGDTVYGEVSFAQATPYRVVLQGTKTLSAGDINQDL